MSDYTQITDFSVKDGLTTGDPEKLILGADFDGEFSAISTAVASKYDSADIASQVQVEAEALDTVLVTPLKLAQWADDNAGIVGDLRDLTDPGQDTLLGWDDGAGAAIHFTPDSTIAFSGTTFGIDHLGFEDLTSPGADRLVFFDNTTGALEWMTVNTGLVVTGGTGLRADILGLQDLTDPGADRIFFWDDGGTAAGFLQATNGLEISGTSLQLADAAATTSNPVDISSGVVDLDLSALTTVEGNALAATDLIFVEDGGAGRAVQVQEAGLRVQTAQATQTLAAADMNSIMEFTGTATLTIPANSTTDLPVGVPIVLNMRHASQILTVTAASGVDLVSVYHPAGATAESDSVDAGGTAILFQTADDRWVLSGDISD